MKEIYKMSMIIATIFIVIELVATGIAIKGIKDILNTKIIFINEEKEINNQYITM